MKTPSIALFLVLILTAAVFGQETNKPATIDVVGTAEIMVEPDEVSISLDITKLNKDLDIARSEAESAREKVFAATRKFNIKPEDVKTNQISVEMRYQSVRDPKNRIFDDDGDEIGTRTFIGYQVEIGINIRLKDIKRFNEFFTELLGSGVSEIDNVSFDSSKRIEYVKEARIMAMKAAQEKASAMAGAIGQTIGKAISITEGTGNIYRSSGVLNSNSNIVVGTVSESESLTAFSPGAIKISSQVSVTFLLN
jgi:uncharacterized protein YggE